MTFKFRHQGECNAGVGRNYSTPGGETDCRDSRRAKSLLKPERNGKQKRFFYGGRESPLAGQIRARCLVANEGEFCTPNVEYTEF